MSDSRLVVTGANGYVASALISAVRGTRRVLGISRRSGGALSVPVERIDGIGPATEWASHLMSGDVVLHAAALVHVREQSAARRTTEFREVNVLGTERLALAAAKVGVRRLIFLSSAAVFGSHSRESTVDEATPPAPSTEYGKSKADAEEVLRQVSRNTSLDVVILRLPMIYGPRAPGNFSRLARLVSQGVPLPLGATTNARSFVYIENVVSAVTACIDAPQARNQTFLVADEHAPSTAELIREMAAAIGRAPRLWRCPAPLLASAAFLAGRRRQLNQLTGSLVLSTDRIKGLLGWMPPVSWPRGIHASMEPFRIASAG